MVSTSPGRSPQRGRTAPNRRDDWLRTTRGLRLKASENLARGVAAAGSPAGWTGLLDFAAREGVLPLAFHNIVLLQQQLPTASRVLTESQWQRLGRWPSKGTTAVRLWQPRPQDSRRPDVSRHEAHVAFAPPDTHPSAGPGGPSFLLAPMFDLTQTSGAPVPSLPMERSVQHREALGAWSELLAAAEDAGVEVIFEDLSDGRSGFVAWDDRVIVLAGRDGDEPARCSALAEQFTRLRLGRSAGDTLPDVGLVAASAARVTARRFGFPARDVVLPDDWETADGDRVRLCGEAVVAAARPLVSRLDSAGVGLDFQDQTAVPSPPLVAAVAP